MNVKDFMPMAVPLNAVPTGYVPRARNTDPVTSHAAGAKVRKLSIRQTVMFDLLNQGAYGAVGKEIAERKCINLNSITPRFAELRGQGRIKDSGRRRDGQIVWVRT